MAAHVEARVDEQFSLRMCEAVMDQESKYFLTNHGFLKFSQLVTKNIF